MKSSFFNREVAALEKFLKSRDRLKSPVIGDRDFSEVLLFCAYASRRFGLRVEDLQEMLAGMVDEGQKANFLEKINSTIANGNELAFDTHLGELKGENNTFTKDGFIYESESASKT